MLKLSKRTIEDLKHGYCSIFTSFEYTKTIHLHNIRFENEDVNNALDAIIKNLKQSEIFDYLDQMADFNCCNGIPEHYNELKKEYHFVDNFGDTTAHIELEWYFDGEKYSTREAYIYLNFKSDTELSLDEKVKIIEQKTKEFIYGWNIVKEDLIADQENYIKKLKIRDKELEQEEAAERQKISDNEVKETEEDNKFIDFCKNFKA